MYEPYNASRLDAAIELSQTTKTLVQPANYSHARMSHLGFMCMHRLMLVRNKKENIKENEKGTLGK